MPNEVDAAKESRFQIMKNGKCHMSGPVSILYDRETRRQMRSAGYTIKIDGKVFRQ